jgi:hypothetical protein
MRLASTDSAGWTVDTVDLALTARRRRRPGQPGSIGDAPQLCVRRNGYLIACCAGPEDLAAPGVDLRMAVVDRWSMPWHTETPPSRTRVIGHGAFLTAASGRILTAADL